MGALRECLRVCDEAEGDATIPEALFDDDGELDEAHILCSKCGSRNCTEALPLYNLYSELHCQNLQSSRQAGRSTQSDNEKLQPQLLRRSPGQSVGLSSIKCKHNFSFHLTIKLLYCSF